MKRVVAIGLTLYCGFTWTASAADVFVAQKIHEKDLQGRALVRYEHDCLPEWGPVLVKRQYFNVLLPKTKKDTPTPLIVYLHSAGGNADREAPICAEFAAKAGPEFMGLMPNSSVSDIDGWWGREGIVGNRERYANKLTPTEARVLATIEWVVKNYNVDRNRIYVCGISMGGSGALGLGMSHGDVFASIWVGVPAGAMHAMHRMRVPEPAPANAPPAAREEYLRAVSGQGLPDAPPILNFSSQTDGYAKDQPQLLRAVHDGRHAMVFAWGPWGHSNSYDKTHRAAYEYPWLTIRKNEAYPVFTDASTDQSYPGSNPARPDADGQINAFFRWQNVTDTPDELTIELRLVSKADLSRPAPLPTQATADVTLRRLQKFKVQADKTYVWRFGPVRSGQVRPDPAGLLTIPQLDIADKPKRLTIQPVKRD
jgi:predicted esterase